MIRRVASPEGSRYYGLPIGAPIGAALQFRIARVKGPEPEGATAIQPENASEATDLRMGRGHHTLTTALQAVAQGRSDLIRVPSGFTVSGVSKDSAHADVFAADADGNFYAMMPNSGSIVKIEPVDGLFPVASPRKGQTVTWADDMGSHTGRVSFKGSKKKKPYYSMETSAGEYITTIWPEGKPPVGTSKNALDEEPGVVVAQVYSPKVNGTAPNGMRKVKITAATDPGAADGHLEYNGQSWMGRISPDLAPDYSQRVPPNGYFKSTPDADWDKVQAKDAQTVKDPSFEENNPLTPPMTPLNGDPGPVGPLAQGNPGPMVRKMMAKIQSERISDTPSNPQLNRPKSTITETGPGTLPGERLVGDPEDKGTAPKIDIDALGPHHLLSVAQLDEAILSTQEREEIWQQRLDAAKRGDTFSFPYSVDFASERRAKYLSLRQQLVHMKKTKEEYPEMDLASDPTTLKLAKLQWAMNTAYAKQEEAKSKYGVSSEVFQKAKGEFIVARSAYLDLKEKDTLRQNADVVAVRPGSSLGMSQNQTDDEATALYLSRMDGGEFLR